MSRYEIRPFREGDRRALLDARRRASAADGLPASTEDEWHWAVLANPAGTRLWLARDEAEVVALVAAVPRRVRARGRDVVFAHLAEAWVVPERRRGVEGVRVLFDTARAFLAAWGDDVVYYGHPEPRAWRLAHRRLKAALVRTEAVLVRAPGEGDEALPGGVEPLERFDGEVRALHERCAAGWGAGAVRDEAYLNWRYPDRPGRRYVSLAARDAGGSLRGVAVYRSAAWDGWDVGLAVEWLVPPAEPEAGELLFRALLAQARAERRELVATLIPDWSPWFEHFQRWGFQVHPTDRFLAARHFDRRFDPSWLRNSWWYQLGDTDLV